jgi:hypothetical protein
VSCRVPDLAVVFHVRLTDGSVVDVACRPRATTPQQPGPGPADRDDDDLDALVAGAS